MIRKLLISILIVSPGWAQTTTWIRPDAIQEHYTWMDSLNRFEGRLDTVVLTRLAVVNGPFQDIQGENLNAEIRGLVGISSEPDGVWIRLPGLHWPEWHPLEPPVNFRGASGIWATPDGKIFVSRASSHTISEYALHDGKIVTESAWGSPGRTDGQLGGPVGIAVSRSGDYYVLERLNNRISIFNADRQFRKAVYPSRNYALRDPVAFTLHDGDQHWTHLRESFLVVIDNDGQRMVKLDSEGRVLAVIKPDFPFKSFEFRQVVTDYYGSIYVTDPMNHRVHKFDAGLNYLVSMGPETEGEQPGFPQGIAIDNQFGQVWVSDSAGTRYYWLGTDTLDFRVGFSSMQNAVLGRFRLTEPAYVTISVKNPDGKTLDMLVERKKTLFDPLQFQWSIPWGFQSNAVELEVELTPTYASRRHFTKLIKQTIYLP